MGCASPRVHPIVHSKEVNSKQSNYDIAFSCSRPNLHSIWYLRCQCGADQDVLQLGVWIWVSTELQQHSGAIWIS